MFERRTEALPDLLTRGDGAKVTAADWPVRRAELLRQVLDIEYGQLPPAPEKLVGRRLHEHKVHRFSEASHAQYHLEMTCGGKPFRLLLDLLVPPGGEACKPVVLSGDNCWLYLSDAVRTEVLSRGYILASFNRLEIAPDDYSPARDCGLYLAYPEADFGAISAWAWGYHRCVDFLATLPEVDASRIAITGHSRGGKTVLLAGATDERIAVTVPNNSGCAGGGSFKVRGEKCERIADMMKVFPHWLLPGFAQYAGKEENLPFDQHAVKALVAPRALLTTEALSDPWANPFGSYQTHLAAQEVYRLLGVEDKIAIHFREGVHDHALADWQKMLDFARKIFGC